MKYKAKNGNNIPKKNESSGPESLEHSMLFVNQKEVWVSNGSAINVYNPVSGSLIEIKEKHHNKIISLCRVSDIFEEEYEIVSCDEKGLVCYWCNKDHKHYDKSFSIHIKENSRITDFIYGDPNCVVTFTGNGETTLNLIRLEANISKTILITKNVKVGKQKVALSYDRNYVAALKDKILYVEDLTAIFDREKQLIRKNHKTGKMDPQCIDFHPTKLIIAVGYTNGCITLWYEFTEQNPTKVNMHWHTLPAKICFSSTGGDLYSGGQECVLVRWYLNDDNRRSFLPRLGMPIVNVQCDPTSTYIAVLHIDDSISIINSKERKLEGALQRLSKYVPVFGDSNIPPSKILLHHEPTSSFVRTGKTGYLQFFNPLQSKVNYDLDITMTNFVTAERNKKLPNVEITYAAISEDGVWLATVEMCLLTPSLKEIIMKFWHYSLKAQRWELNTTIHTPHLDIISSLVFCTLMEEANPTCISCSKDGKFKVWKLVTYLDLKGAERSLWNSQTLRSFRGLPATACAFSQDTSLMAVAFDSIITLWCPEKFVLKRVLTQSFLTETITTIIFSHERWKGSALITRSENYICTWDLLSCTLLWRVYVRSSCLVKDPQTGLLAAFANCNDVYFFDPQNSEPISSNHNIESEVACAIFSPNMSPNKEKAKKKTTSTLFYYDKNQNLHYIEPPSLESPESTERDKDDKRIAVQDVEVGVREDVNQSSDLFSALSAKTKKITSKKSEELPATDVDLTAPSLKDMLKDLHEVQIHNLTFTGLVEHFNSFLPSLCLISGIKIKQEEKLKYETFDEERRKRKEKKRTLDSYLNEESQRIEKIQNYDFNNLLKLL